MRTYSEEEKLSHLELLKESGLSVNEYAREKDITETTLRDWIKVDRELGFGKININKPFSTVTGITNMVKKPMVFVSENIRVELREGFDKNFLRQIIEVLCNAN